MPTKRPRYLLTENDTISAALTAAAARWPAERDNPTRLLLHVIAEGGRVLAEQAASARTDRESAITASSGRLTGAFPPDHLQQLRDDWPA